MWRDASFDLKRAYVWVSKVGFAAWFFGVVYFPYTQMHIRTSSATLRLWNIDPPGTIDIGIARALCPQVTATVIRWVRTIAIEIRTVRHYAIAFALGLVEHAVGTATTWSNAKNVRSRPGGPGSRLHDGSCLFAIETSGLWRDCGLRCWLAAYIRVWIDGVATYLSGVIDLPQTKRHLKIKFGRRICDKRNCWYNISWYQYFFTRPIQENGPADEILWL